MKIRLLGMGLILLVLGVAPGMGRAQEGEEPAQEGEEKRELSFAGSPYIFSGPDTGAGAGFSILYRNLFQKEGRDVTFSMSYTQNLYQDYSINWSEPYFLSEQGRFNLGLSYATRPALRFFPLGNDTEQHGTSCNYAFTSYVFEPMYVYRMPVGEGNHVIGLRFSLRWKYADADNGQLKDDDLGSFGRPIRSVYPRFYRSYHFEPRWLIGPSITLYHDSRRDRFPLGGGREEVVYPVGGGYQEVSYTRIDEAFGSDLSYNYISLGVRHFFPLFSEDTILALRFRTVITQGDVPFYEMPTYGSGNDLRGYYSGRFVDKNATQFQVELRQGFFPDEELPLFGGLISLKYPSLFIFWDEARVYDDYTEILPNLFKEYQYAYGFGFRFIVTPSVVIRLEFGFSDEQQTSYITASLPF